MKARGRVRVEGVGPVIPFTMTAVQGTLEPLDRGCGRGGGECGPCYGVAVGG